MPEDHDKAASKSGPAEGGVLESLSFEGAMEALETVVDRLEDGELPLEDALLEFERGVALSRRCHEQLDAADRRIEVLIEQNGHTVVEPFDLGSNGEEDSAEGEV
ncbi:MAG: exodeoxyribonuclease VII small subunit [Deltaproteobacteria bacterium]|nr:exodeoxyribonuclease VII small subunit [Deltaproteobacteria bacterium]